MAGFRNNIRSILELRLNQFPTLDRELGRAIQKSIEDLPEFPPQALGNMRNIAERSFAIIWTAEFEERKIPSQVFAYWRQKGTRGIERFERLIVPGELRPQCRLLQLLKRLAERFDQFDPTLATTARMENLGANGGEGDEALAAVCNSGVIAPGKPEKIRDGGVRGLTA